MSTRGAAARAGTPARGDKQEHADSSAEISSVPADLHHFLREIPHELFPREIRASIERVENAGAHVTCFEIINTGALILYTNSGTQPSPDRVRALYLAHARAEATA